MSNFCAQGAKKFTVTDAAVRAEYRLTNEVNRNRQQHESYEQQSYEQG